MRQTHGNKRKLGPPMHFQAVSSCESGFDSLEEHSATETVYLHYVRLTLGS